MADNILLNSVKVNNLISNLDNYNNQIEKSLFDMSDIMTNISSCIEGNVGNEILKKFSEFEDYFSIINSNIKDYITDFKSLVNNFVEFDSKISTNEVTDISNEGGDIINVKN